MPTPFVQKLEAGDGPTFLVFPGRGLTPVDVPASVLVLAARTGPIAGDDHRRERNELADLIPDDDLSARLRSAAPMLVAAEGSDGWRFIF